MIVRGIVQFLSEQANVRLTSDLMKYMRVHNGIM